jgi:hypothetical protein
MYFILCYCQINKLIVTDKQKQERISTQMGKEFSTTVWNESTQPREIRYADYTSPLYWLNNSSPLGTNEPEVSSRLAGAGPKWAIGPNIIM